MRVRFVAATVGLGAVLLSGCTNHLPKAVRLEVPEGGHYTPGRHYVPHGEPKVHVTGPDRLRLFDGDPLMGEVAFINPEIVRFADGLTIPRTHVGWIEFNHPQPAPGLSGNRLHDSISLTDGSIIEGALISLDDADVHIAVYPPGSTSGHITTVPRTAIAAAALRDRRGSACGRAAVVLAHNPAAGQPIAEVSSQSLDVVHVMWLEDAQGARPERVMRCFPNEHGASGCQVMYRVDADAQCDAGIDGLAIHAVADNVAHMSEARNFYYTLRDDEYTLGKSETLRRDNRHAHMVRPARLTGTWRGEAHYWDRSWREQQDEGMHAVK